MKTSSTHARSEFAVTTFTSKHLKDLSGSSDSDFTTSSQMGDVSLFIISWPGLLEACLALASVKYHEDL